MPQAVCLKCDGCCRFAEKDSAWSPKLLKEEQGDPSFCGKDLAPVPRPGHEAFFCPQLDVESNKCLTYKSRPFECQLYPFVLNRKEEKCFLAVDLNCPFIEMAHNTREFKKYVKYLTEFLHNPDFMQILKNNPQIILPYEGALNLVEIRI